MNVLVLILSLLGGRAHVVAAGQPTGDLSHGDVLVEVGGTRAACDRNGGWTFTVDTTVWCLGEDF